MRLELVTTEIHCKMRVCVKNKERTNQEPANNQEYAQHYTISEVGIPMLILQVTLIISFK